MKTNFLEDGYLTVNLVFAAIIVAIISYSYIFNAQGKRYPLPSGVPEFNKESSISTGLSRSFSEIVRFRFKEAASFNPHGIRLFFFFFIQLLLRVAISVLLLKRPAIPRQWLVATDVIISLSLFALAFRPFIAALS